MIFNILYILIKNYDDSLINLNIELYLGVIVYLLFLNIKFIYNYSSLIIPLDLYILNKAKIKRFGSKKFNKIDNKKTLNNFKNKKKNIIKNITDIIYNYFYNKEDEYVLKPFDIKDTIQHTLDNINV